MSVTLHSVGVDVAEPKLEEETEEDKLLTGGMVPVRHACWHCKSELIWNNDYSFEEVGFEGNGLLTHLSCSGCGAFYEIHKLEEVQH